MPLMYDELRRIARGHLRSQRPDHTLQPTALVNEAYLKLFEHTPPQLVDRAHFLALMSRVMRQVLVDHARALATAKRGGQEQRAELISDISVEGDQANRQLSVLELDRALGSLAKEDSGMAEVIEMHYFGGMTAEETAVVVGRSAHVVRHEIRLARAWLRRELSR